MNNKFTFLILIFSFLQIGCKNENKSVIKKHKETKIKIIFNKRTFITDTLKDPSGPYTFIDLDLFYSKEGSFIKHNIPKNNYNKSDTIIIKTDKNIFFHHGFNVTQNMLYCFEPGDVVIFNYKNDYPVCNILNKNKTSLSLNYLFNLINVNKPKNVEFEFFVKNKKLMSLEEKAIEKNKNIKKYKTLITKVDSLKKQKKIDENNYNLFKNNLLSNINETKLNYISELNLSIPKDREILYNSFNIAYKPKYLKVGNGSIIDSKIQFDKVLYDKKITKKNKDYLLYTYFDEIIMNFTKQDIEKYFDLYEKNVNNTELVNEFKNKILSLNNDNINDVILINKEKKEFKLKELIANNYKNKVVYVDFWASWCTPCRQLTPFSKQLHKEYENKNVVFLYISIDKDYDQWLNAVQKDKISNENNYLSINYPQALFYKELNLKTIPRFLLFNKTGKLIHENAPGPDNKEIRKEFNKLLSK